MHTGYDRRVKRLDDSGRRECRVIPSRRFVPILPPVRRGLHATPRPTLTPQLASRRPIPPERRVQFISLLGRDTSTHVHMVTLKEGERERERASKLEREKE
jgi:hypothetical protein